MEQRYGTDPSRRYGTGVWNGGMERVWSRSLFRTSYFDLPPYIYVCIHIYILYIYIYVLYNVIVHDCTCQLRRVPHEHLVPLPSTDFDSMMYGQPGGFPMLQLKQHSILRAEELESSYSLNCAVVLEKATTPIPEPVATKSSSKCHPKQTTYESHL